MTFRNALAAALYALAMKQPPHERAAWLDILRKDGWL